MSLILLDIRMESKSGCMTRLYVVSADVLWVVYSAFGYRAL